MRSIEVFDGPRRIPYEIVIPSGEVPITMRALHSVSESHWQDPIMRRTLEGVARFGRSPDDLPDERAAFQYHELVSRALSRFERHEDEDATETIRLRGTAIPLLGKAILEGLSLRNSKACRRVAEEMIANRTCLSWEKFMAHTRLYPKAWLFDEQPQSWLGDG